MTIHASVLVADDLLYSVSGKITITGAYPNDIMIFGEENHATQIVFLFHVEGTQAELPRNFRFEIALPGEPPRIKESPVPIGWQVPEGREKWVVTMPIQITGAILRLGKIEARVVIVGETEEETIEIAAPSIISAPSA